MLPETINLQVVTPERQLVNEAVKEVQLPGGNGALGILPGHAPLMTELGVGELSFRKGRETHYLAVVHGYAEVLGDRVVVLAEVCERAEEVDLDRARNAKERAENRLSKRDDPDTDWDRAQFALQRALVRLQVASKAGGVAPEAEAHPHAAP
jgi:F-type H+-transporting ATPase subunit epsilon